MHVNVHRSADGTGAGEGAGAGADHLTLSQSGGKLCPAHYDSLHGFAE